MTDNTYNGWTNYPTWRINLELFSDLDTETVISYGWHQMDAYDMQESLSDYVEEILLMEVDSNSIVASYALAFVNDVNFYEIAEHLQELVTIEDITEAQAEEAKSDIGFQVRKAHSKIEEA